MGEKKNLKGTIAAFNTYHTDAYNIAVRNGFEGTEAEWLESLKGEKGDPGKAGYTPVKGVDYFDGEKGDKGDPCVDITTIQAEGTTFTGFSNSDYPDGYYFVKRPVGADIVMFYFRNADNTLHRVMQFSGQDILVELRSTPSPKDSTKTDRYAILTAPFYDRLSAIWDGEKYGFEMQRSVVSVNGVFPNDQTGDVTIPKAVSVADAAGATVTGAEFNALLAALRSAGYLAT